MLEVNRKINDIEELIKRSGDYIQVEPEVYQGLKDGSPVVAFETVTALHHGASGYPENAELMVKMSDAAKELGVIPAIIAINKGVLKIGLSNSELDQIAEQKNNLSKVGCREIPIILSNNGSGITTASGTIQVASMAGIEFVVSAGIGGVHLGAQNTFDISPDLQSLANNNVALICSGSKSIIDHELTLEYLETYGIPVFGYKTNNFSSLCVRESDCGIDNSFNLPDEVADTIDIKWKLNISGGVLVINPIDEKYSLNKGNIDSQISIALDEMKKIGIKGSECTTYLLNKVDELTKGESQLAIQKLLVSNATLAAQVAAKYSELKS